LPLDELAFIGFVLIARLLGPGVFGLNKWNGVEQDIFRLNISGIRESAAIDHRLRVGSEGEGGGGKSPTGQK
jgi:hypothetical protein